VFRGQRVTRAEYVPRFGITGGRRADTRSSEAVATRRRASPSKDHAVWPTSCPRDRYGTGLGLNILRSSISAGQPPDGSRSPRSCARSCEPARLRQRRRRHRRRQRPDQAEQEESPARVSVSVPSRRGRSACVHGRTATDSHRRHRPPARDRRSHPSAAVPSAHGRQTAHHRATLTCPRAAPPPGLTPR
jgi:hypothetical protein